MAPKRPPWYTSEYPSDCQYNSPGCDMDPLAKSGHANEIERSAVRSSSKWLRFIGGYAGETIDLSNVGITDEDIDHLIPVFEKTNIIKSIDLSGNLINNSGINALCMYLLENTVCEINLIGNSFDYIGKSQLEGMQSVQPATAIHFH